MEISEVSGEEYNTAMYFDEKQSPQEEELFAQIVEEEVLEEQLSKLSVKQHDHYDSKPESRPLPEDFTVYTNGQSVVDHAYAGPDFKACSLPTVNHYTGSNGGYVALYSHEEKGSAYSIGNGIYVMGQVRIPGQYKGRIFVPEGYQLGDNITKEGKILEICKQYFPDLEDFWIGGDTGGWYGIQH